MKVNLLGLTCDPVGGLVQIPCIECNAMVAIKAINAARLALRSDGQHYVSLIHLSHFSVLILKNKNF